MPKNRFFSLDISKQKRIEESAIAEFAENGYEKSSVHRIVENASISTGSFYQYFEDKKDLYFYIMYNYMSKLQFLSKTVQKQEIFSYNSRFTPSAPVALLSDNKHFNKIFIDSYNNAPVNIKRDWVFDKLIGEKNFELYDLSVIEDSDLPDIYKENKELLASLILAARVVVEKFAEYSDYENYKKLYQLVTDIILDGIFFKSEQHMQNMASKICK